jgi:pimeloyl-ACP methyl ester carboxylesterase
LNYFKNVRGYNMSNTKGYIIGSTISKDGTKIGYRQMGDGPGIILIHGPLSSSQNLMKLGLELSKKFTVYMPDRRGRGLSGPFGNNYGLEKEVEDLDALITKTGADFFFGDSTGAIIILKSTLTLPSVRKIALHEPLVYVNDSEMQKFNTAVKNFDKEISEGKNADALINISDFIDNEPSLLYKLPDSLTKLIFGLILKIGDIKVKSDNVKIKDLMLTLKYDAQLVNETKGQLDSFKDISAEVLLLCGSKPSDLLKDSVHTLNEILPNLNLVELEGLNHNSAQNNGSPEEVSIVVRKFFTNRLYTKSTVTSKDGTVIGYRQMGSGPGLILMHGDMGSSQHFMGLANALSDVFRVYIPDRRGRGLSGPFGDNYGLQKEIEDMDALLKKTGAHFLFGASSGALIILQSSLILGGIDKIALYEPMVYVNKYEMDKFNEINQRVNQEIAEGNLTSAMVTGLEVITKVNPEEKPPSPIYYLPSFVWKLIFRMILRSDNKYVKGDDVLLKDLLPTRRYDNILVNETEGKLENYKNISAEVLLIGGSKSSLFLKHSLDALKEILPNVNRVELKDLDHDSPQNTRDPEVIAQEIILFFL